MPFKDPAKAKANKQRYYSLNKDRIKKEDRDRRAWAKAHPDLDDLIARRHDYAISYSTKKRRQLLAISNEFKRHGCSMCPEKDPVCLDAHHVDPASKLFTVGKIAMSRTLIEVMDEYAKCICVCSNCHRKLHAANRQQENV